MTVAPSFGGSGSLNGTCTSGCVSLDTNTYGTYYVTSTTYPIFNNCTINEGNGPNNKKKSFKERLEEEIDEWCGDVLEDE